jgi:hypothetical protein
MITDYYHRTAKKRAKETIQDQDTPQDKERLKITATTSHRKSIPKEQQLGADFITIQSRDHDGASSDTHLHRQTSAWKYG